VHVYSLAYWSELIQVILPLGISANHVETKHGWSMHGVILGRLSLWSVMHLK
jgi:hypothetical protein